MRARYLPGQAMVLILIVMVVLTSVATLSVALVTTSVLSSSREERGAHALAIAESGAEEALLRVLREPSVEVNDLSLTVDEGYATVDIVGALTKTITSAGVVDGYERRVEVEAEINAGQLQINSWREN